MKLKSSRDEIKYRWCAGKSALPLAKVSGVTYTAINKQASPKAEQRIY